tara:strand:+ start:429 stop:1304 length:876 start_codon:yes stop_codon:yes gene_type:complete
LIKNNLFIWVCDYSENSGEGKLARLFINHLNKKKQFNINFNQKKKFKQKYLPTFFGIYYCWKKYLKNEKVCYLNYLPFWNFLIFVFLPPKTIIGPITGGSNFPKSPYFNYLIRGFIFPIFYKISEFFLNLREVEIIFSTDLLKKYLFKKTIKNSKFNYVLKFFSKQKKIKKKIDFVIYYRKHKNKASFFPYHFIRNLVKSNYKISVIGDKLNIPLVKNFGKLPNKKVFKLQASAKYTIASGENIYSIFIMECLSNNVKVIVNKKQYNTIKFFKKKFIKIDYKKFKNFKKIN